MDGSQALGTPRQGGRAEWEASVMPPIGVDLTVQQRLACAFRILAKAGFGEHIAGHITQTHEQTGNMWVNPWGLWWAEITASDVCLVDGDGAVVEGVWDVTPAIHIHTQLHRAQPDAKVVIHNHPYHVSVLAAIGKLPEIVHQTSAMFDQDVGFVSEYTGEVADAELGAQLAEQIGDKPIAILASHGVIVTGRTLEEATFRAYAVDRACRLTFDVMLSGEKALPIAPSLRTALKRSLLERGPEFFWNGAVRQLLRTEPDVLN